MSNESHIGRDRNIVIQSINDGTISLTVEGEIKHIRNDIATLKALLEQQQTQQFQMGKKIYNIGEIGQAEFKIIINQYNRKLKKDKYFILFFLTIMILLVITYHRPTEKIEPGLNQAPNFEENDEDFKILVLPFKQICVQGGKNYDAGYVLTERLNKVIRFNQLKIKAVYWADFKINGAWSSTKAKELQKRHFVDMLIYGSYHTSDCSSEGDQICINYMTDNKWELGRSGVNIASEYRNGGLEELKKGKIQENIENIVTLISTIAQVKNINQVEYISKLKNLLNEPNFTTNSKANVYMELGDRLNEEGKQNEAVECYSKAFDLFDKKNDLEGIAISYYKLGVILKDNGDLQPALECFNESCMIYQYLSDSLSHGNNLDYFHNLAVAYECIGMIYTDLGDLGSALNIFEERKSIAEKLIKKLPDDQEYKNGIAVSHQLLGNAHYALGNSLKALDLFHKCNALYKDLNTAYPDDPRYKLNLGYSYQFIGKVYLSSGRLEYALKYFKKMFYLFKFLHSSHPDILEYKNALSLSYQYLGTVQSSKGQFKLAIFYFKKYFQLKKELYIQNPASVIFKNGLANANGKIGKFYVDNNALDSAYVYLNQSRQLFKELNEYNSQNVEYKNNLAISHQNIGLFFKKKGDLSNALKHFKIYNNLEEGLFRKNPHIVEFMKGTAISYHQLGITYTALKDFENAFKNLQVGLVLFQDLSKEYPDIIDFKIGILSTLENLGSLNFELYNLDKSATQFKEFYELAKEVYENDSTNIQSKTNLGNSYYRLGTLALVRGDKNLAKTYFFQTEKLYTELNKLIDSDEIQIHLARVKKTLSEL